MKRRMGAVLILLVAAFGQAATTASETPKPTSDDVVLLEHPEVRDAVDVDEQPPLRQFLTPIPQDRQSRRLSGPRVAGAPSTGIVFQGLKSDGVAPSDVNGDVGPNHYVQAVNSGNGGTRFSIYDKSGNRLFQPKSLAKLWQRGPCRNKGQGDPVIQYDAMADRWLLTQFAFRSTERGPKPPFYECIALSKTSNVTGAFTTYTFFIDDNRFPDFPKFGVWRDGYYMTVHLFDRQFDFRGQGFIVFDRERMLAGLKPRGSSRDDVPAHYFFTPNDFGALPADVAGTTPPPPGTPNYMLVSKDDNISANRDKLNVMTFDVNWGRPRLSRVVLVDSLPTNPFNSNLCRGSACVPQPARTIKLDALAGVPDLGSFLMYPLVYRNFGTTDVLVANQTVNLGNNRAGIRWYEIGDATTSGRSIFQQGTVAFPSLHRWNGSISIDKNGGIGLGYSVSGSGQVPSVRYVAREDADPPNAMSAESSLLEGGGSQRGTYRWGDYTSMQVDPVDDCTFWYTNQYYGQTGFYDWDTVIGSFKLPGC